MKFFAAIFTLLALAGPVFADRAELIHDGNLVRKTDLKEIGGQDYLPLKSLAVLFKGQTQWQPVANKVILQLNNKKITFNIGSKSILIGSEKASLSAPARMVDGTIFVPVDFFTEPPFTEIAECKVRWDKQLQMLLAVSKATLQLPRVYSGTLRTQVMIESTEEMSPAIKKSGQIIAIDIPDAKLADGESLQLKDRLVRRIDMVRARKGVVIKLELAPGVTSYVHNREEDPTRLVLEIRSPAYFKKGSGNEIEEVGLPERMADTMPAPVPALNDAVQSTEISPKATPASPQSGSSSDSGSGSVSLPVPSPVSIPVPAPSPDSPANSAPAPAPAKSDAQTPAAKAPSPAAAASPAKPSEASVTPVPVPLPVPAKKSRRRSAIKTIVVDAGHGGKDPGAIGRGGTKEKDINLLIALELARILEIEGGYDVLLTRTDDTFVPLVDRSLFANEKKADLFISIHCNASVRRKEGGFEIYYLAEESSDPHAEETEHLENAVIALEDPKSPKKKKLQDLLFSMAQTEFINESSLLSNAVNRSVKKRVNIESRGVKQANFHVLHGVNMPSVLVESGFMTYQAEEQKLRSRKFRSSLVDAILTGVQNYEKELAKLQR